MLEARNLTFSYDGKTPILRSADFQISRGEAILITGETGVGKSTFALTLAGFIPRNIDGIFSGTILIDEEETSTMPISEISRLVALVQQDPDGQICTLKVSDEVVFGPENFLMDLLEIEQALKTSLQAVGAHHLSDRPTYAISGGEKQRTAIASILSSRPNFVIFDEASANLDPKGIESLRKIILNLKEHKFGVICIDHNQRAIARVADRVLHLQDGVLHEVDIPPSPSLTAPEKGPSRYDSERTPLLNVRDVYFSYSRHTAINNVSLSLQRGETIALMGDNGSGKTTLLSLLGGLQSPHQGEILLQSKRIQSYSKKDLVQTIGFVFQNPNHQIFERTVWKEQTLTLQALDAGDDEHLATAEALLKEAHLDALIERNPFSLSHGQKRRLNITSILSHNPEILLLDEPFVGQDRAGRDFVAKIIHRHTSNGGVAVIVTHDMEYALASCNRILFLEDGSVLLDGLPLDVMKQLSALNYSEYTEVLS